MANLAHQDAALGETVAQPPRALAASRSGRARSWPATAAGRDRRGAADPPTAPRRPTSTAMRRRATAVRRQRHPAGDDPRVAQVVRQLHLDQLRHQLRVRQQVAEAQAGERPRLGEGAEEEQVRMARQERPVVVDAELAVGVVEQQRRIEACGERARPRPASPRSPVGLFGLHRTSGRRGSRSTSATQLRHRQRQVGARRQRPVAAAGARHEHRVEAEAGLGTEHLAASVRRTSASSATPSSSLEPLPTSTPSTGWPWRAARSRRSASAWKSG